VRKGDNIMGPRTGSYPDLKRIAKLDR